MATAAVSGRTKGATRLRARRTAFVPVKASLADLLGSDYVAGVCRARAFLTGGRPADLAARFGREIDFYPKTMQRRVVELLDAVGSRAVESLPRSAAGVTTRAFSAATHTAAAPLGGFGLFRIAEDGRLYLVTKGEHYHAPLGHSFPGYQLIEEAHSLGIPQPTHNNTRGHITRLLEEQLIAAANGIGHEGNGAITRLANAAKPDVLNRVLNLETGSLAAEAAIKLVLARFYQVQPDSPQPRYAGRTPVMLVLGDDDGGLQGNYHGTTIVAQVMRGMWPQLLPAFEKQGTLAVRCIRANNPDDLELAFRRYDLGPYKIAGFFHELVMMNYGAKALSRSFIRQAYALCRQHDVPTVVDEIQTGLWSPRLLMFREYGLRPSAVAIGKGFPGGEYCASRLLFTADLDILPQFGALVTNGQEELASLAYLITMRWAQANAEVTAAVGDCYEQRLRELADKHSRHLTAVEGCRHLAGLHFHDVTQAKAFARKLNEWGFDISVQTYKATCPPAALTKLPLTAGYEVVDFVVNRMDAALGALG